MVISKPYVLTEIIDIINILYPGIMGAAPRYPPADGGPLHVYVGPALRGAAQAAL